MKIFFKLISCLAASLSILTAPAGTAHAQESESAPRASYLFSDGIVAPESPEASAVARYGDVADCNLNTGAVGYSIPVYTYQDRDFTIPIALSYSSNGYRPNIQSGVMGLGWYPSTGWSITREVRGIMDDAWPDLELYHFEHRYKYTRNSQDLNPQVTVYGYGFMHHPQYVYDGSITSIASSNLQDELVLQSKAGAEYMPVKWLDVTGSTRNQLCFETEPDVFSFNAPGGASGKFILRPDGGASFFDTSGPESAYSVSVTLERSGFTCFVITDPAGYRYTYAEADSNESWSQRVDNDNIASYGSWRITSVEAPSGRKILFTYGVDSASLSIMPSRTIEVNYRLGKEYLNGQVNDYEDDVTEHEFGGTWNDMNYSRTYSACLTGISVRNADNAEVCNMAFSYTAKAHEQGADSYGCYKLSGITVKNSLGRTVKSCTLDYVMDYASGRFPDEYDAGETGVTFLKSVTLSGEGTYSFEYRDRATTTFPGLGTWGTDWYGYWNPAVTSATSFAPQTLAYCRQNISTSPWLTSLRQAAPSYAAKGMLERIGYPTGGWTTFSFEANSYSRDKSCMCSQTPLRSGTASGVRVSRISSFDSDGTEVRRRDFSYVKEDGVTSSGELIWRPSVYTQYHLNGTQFYMLDREVMSTANDYPYSSGDFMGYLRVLESVYNPATPMDKAITEYVFSQAETGACTTFTNPISVIDSDTFGMVDMIWTCNISSNLPLGNLYAGLFNCQQGTMKGRLLSKTEYAGSLSCPVTRTTYAYEDYGDIEYIDYMTMRMGFGTTERLFYRGVHPKGQTVEYYDSRDHETVIPASRETLFYDGLHRVSEIRLSSGSGGWLETFYDYCEDAPALLRQVATARDGSVVSCMRYDYTRPDATGHPLWRVPLRAQSALIETPNPLSEDYLNDIEYRIDVTLGSYDAAGNPHTLTDAEGNVTVWEWGGEYRMMHPTARMVYPAGQSGPALTTRWTWIPLVGPASETSPSGKLAEYTYDTEGRLRSVRENGNPLVCYDYSIATEDPVEIPPVWAPEFGNPEEGSAIVPCTACTYAVELTSCETEDVDFDSVLDGIFCQLAENGGGSWVTMQRYAYRSNEHITLYVDFAENGGPQRSVRLGEENCCLTITQQAVDSLSLGGGNWTMATRYGNGRADGSARTHDVTHYDGLGYPVQETAALAADGVRDIVTPRLHDALLREVYFPLPFPAESRGGRMQDPFGEQGTWYNDLYDTDEGSSASYRKEMENCPSGRTLEEFLPGYEMADHPSTYEYFTNTAADGIRILSSDPVSGALVVGVTYAPGTLSGVRTTDGDGRTMTTWTDIEGRTVREDREVSGTVTATTLYAYDWKGRLTWAIQPEGAAHLGDITTPACEAAQNWCFTYRYDGLDRVVEKRIPGKGCETFTYDDLDRVLTSRDANQESMGEHVGYSYDALGREVFRRLVKEPSSGSGSSTYVPLMTSVYDSYASAAAGTVLADGVYEAGTAVASPSGLLTVQTVALLDSASPDAAADVEYATRTFWYDSRERVVQTLEQRPDGSSIRTSFSYDLQGNVLRRKETVTGATGATDSRGLLSEYSYDARGRALSLARKLFDGNTGTVLDTVRYAYNNLGQLASKTVGGKIAESYGYDMRGWTKDIAAGRGNDLIFSEGLRYEYPTTSGAVSQYSGNISEIETVQRGCPKDIYAYSYDGLSRLTDARHFIGGPAGASNTDTERFMEYDLNGNLTSLQRYGGSPSDCSTLLFGYTGNRLTGAAEIRSRNITNSSYAYDQNGNRTSDGRTALEFTYNLLNLPCEVRDSQDNMQMRYTYLSDGTKVSALDAAGDGLLYRGNFVYEKDGQNISLESIAWDEGRIRNKLFQALLHDDESIDVTDTLEVIDTLPGIPWHPKEPFFPGLLAEEGHWVEADTTELVLGPAIDREPLYQDQWFVRDHLGNVRSVIDLTKSASMPADSVILEQNDYLPYGTKSSTSSLSTDSAFRYRYAGKEEQRFGAFDSQLLDFGARYYDPWSFQWTAVDPMAEKYVGMSLFNYCNNNPILIIDPYGADSYRFDRTTASLTLVEKNDKPTDDIVKCKFDKTTGEYSVKRRKDGSAKVQVEDIEKGIVFDGMSFNDNANVIDVTSNGAHLSNVEKFLVDFSDNCLNKEIAGTYYSSNNSDSVDYVHIGATKNNSETESYSVPSIYSVRRDLFGNIRPVGHWHTHPSNRSWDSRSTPSTQDLNFRSRHPEIPHFILTNSDYGNSVEKIPY